MTIRHFKANRVPKPEVEPPLFGNFHKIILEIGAGAGLHSIQLAKKNPDAAIIAIEKTRNKFESLKGRSDSHPELKNLFVVHANAINWCTHFLARETVHEVYILYPNPYPKDPQKRWFRMPFMEFLISRIKPGGRITLATNIQSYIDEAISKASQWGLKVNNHRQVLKADGFRTHFEKKYLERGQLCWNADFTIETMKLKPQALANPSMGINSSCAK